MDKPKLHSPDLTRSNIERLAELFPGCVTEARDDNGKLKKAIDFDQLRQELSDNIVEGPQERYHLNWPGKREALLAANAPIAKTLRPCREESVDFDTTKNLFIEGDNLDALKLLQETYLNKIKMIYIDPPYNTGNDFIYNDDFAEEGQAYFRRSTQVDEAGNKLVSNKETNGRFHSDWMSMLYSRLKLSRHLLREDGVIFISIDDCEVANLRKLCEEVFGAENFIGQLVWKSRISEDTRAKTGLSTDHEYVICFRKSVKGILRGVEKDLHKFKNPDQDERGPWRSADMTGLATEEKRPNLHYDLIDPKTKINYRCPNKGWRFDRAGMDRRIEEERIIWPASEDGRPRLKLFLGEIDSLFKNMSSVVQSFSTSGGTRELNELIGVGVYDFPKPSAFVSLLVEQVVNENQIVLDYFAGSGTTADAVMQLNAKDGRIRSSISVQLPERTGDSSQAEMQGFETISDIAKERIRRAGAKIRREKGLEACSQDVGFRVLQVDTSNMKDVYYTPDTIAQDDLYGQIDNIKPDRSGEDLLFQVMLDWGLDLALPISAETIAGKTVHFVDGDDLAACFETGIDEAFVKQLAQRKPLRAVFRDTGYDSDNIKINVAQIFRLISPNTDVKSI